MENKLVGLLVGVSLLAILSLAVNALQARRILLFQQSIEEPSLHSSTIIGTKLANDLTVRDPGGREVTIRFASQQLPIVLYVFSPSCKWCIYNSTLVNATARQTTGRFVFIGVSLSEGGLAEFTKEYHLEFPVYSSLPDSLVNTLKLGRTPQTIVVSPSGFVVENWVGAYTGITKVQAEKYFAIRIPDPNDVHAAPYQ